ncbi:type I-E CRISPR-associated protein Cse2/CasB [Corynebacterium spheniscorum]|uniref:CRISPR system Cascade subunit CasB n=1 Tax=Corynebacterium spheniscorum TaxID=185761 RepID=A0A1I2QA82_9CORY|nr:type I-E CRISPR-associated protein Cse2/CasB [Corynebacterium spheniscorum]KAA8719630.1 type I-E CRISPR-associated protein Cse2/CasB [Corynebacterium spheniscorum]SFG25292.1 CRISPR system Cascade subunit CasB [Corynebacterium spheniscorum]
MITLNRQELDLLAQTVARNATVWGNSAIADRSTGRAALAALRHPSQEGFNAASWSQVLENFPVDLAGCGDEPSIGEWAAHLALTVFAFHQQSKTHLMHKSGQGLGRAVRQLALRDNKDEPDSGVLRRYKIVLQAPTIEATAYHLRGLVQLLRQADIPLDYGRLAMDLANLRNPRRSDGVRLRWSREFYLTPREENQKISEAGS